MVVPEWIHSRHPPRMLRLDYIETPNDPTLESGDLATLTISTNNVSRYGFILFTPYTSEIYLTLILKH